MKIDPRTIDRKTLEAKVREVVPGSSSTREAERRIKSCFFPEPLVVVQERGKENFSALVLSFPGASSLSIICSRN